MKFDSRLVRLTLVAALATGFAACDDGPTDPPVVPLGTVSGLSASFDGDAVEVSWSGLAGAETYIVERDDISNSEGYVEIAGSVTGTSYSDQAVVRGTSYSYRVRGVRGTEQGAPGTVNIGIPSEPIAEFSGTVGPGERRVLHADTTYTMEGAVVVDSGAVLEIQPGTLILGDVEVRGTALFVRIGGRIEAEGTADAPIVFTSSAPAGERRRGDWGGIVINGRSICSFGPPCQGEGDSGTYGRDPAVEGDDSGIMRYVRIEYAGYEVSLDNEINALTLNGVGSGTTLEYIQAHFHDDDGIEWFGGTVDLKYALTTFGDDDGFDFSTGWQGRGQFWITQQDLASGDRGWEVDGNEENFSATPLTDPLVYNFTVIGKGPEGAAGASPAGLQLRRGVAGNYYNGIVMGFDNGLDIDDAETAAHCLTGGFEMSSMIFFQNTNTFDADSDAFEASCVADSDYRTADPMLADPYNLTAPDFRPENGSPALTGATTPPADDFFTSVDFVGAVAASGDLSTWWQGWTTFAQN
jgi:hypothetical protein